MYLKVTSLSGTDDRFRTTQPWQDPAEHAAEVSALEAAGTKDFEDKHLPQVLKTTVPDEVANPPTPVKSGPVRGTPRAIPKDSDHAAAIIARSGGIRDDEGHDLIKGRGLQQMCRGPAR
jgi:hypothetical protein